MKFLGRLEQCWRWPQQNVTIMFVLISRHVASERSIALLPTLIRWWEGLREQEWHRVCWDATDGRNGGATVLETERFDHRAREMDQGAITLARGLAQAFERVSLPVVWAWATHFYLTRIFLTGVIWLLPAPAAGSV